MQKRGQAAMEYLMIAGVIAITIIPTMFIFFNYAQESTEQIEQAQIDKFARDVVNTAEIVAFMGSPTRIVLEANLPANVEGISVVPDTVSGNYLLSFAVRTKYGISNISYPTTANLEGSFSPEFVAKGAKRITISAGPVVGGKVKVLLNPTSDLDCDVTLHNSCTGSNPDFCYNGVVFDNCEVCGCDIGTCGASGSCVLPN